MPFRIGSEFLVNTGNTFGIQDTPDIAGTADGGFVVTWRSEFRSGGPDNLDFEIQARAILPGQAIGNEFRVNKLTTDAQISPTVTALADGGFAIAYSSGEEDSLPGTSVNTQFLDANGRATGPELFTDYDYYHRVPEIASFGDDGIVTVGAASPAARAKCGLPPAWSNRASLMDGTAASTPRRWRHCPTQVLS